jgi:phosphatidylglycerophosphate synthase
VLSVNEPQKLSTPNKLDQMNQTKQVIRVSSGTTLAELLHKFLAADQDLVFVDENTVITQPHLELLTDFPRGASAALVGRDNDFADTLVAKGSVLSASSASHSVTGPNRVFTGALSLSQKQRPEIEKAVAEAIASKATGHALDLVLVALVRATIRVDAVEILEAPFVRSSDPDKKDKTSKQIQKLSIPRLRLKMANRANDGFFSVYVLRRFSKLLTWVAVKIGATPNQVTIASFAIGLYAAFLFAQGDFWSILIGAVLLQVSIIVDCVDGELARYTRKFSELGAWLDAITDRVKEYAVFLGLAYGAYVQYGQNLWVLAAVLMALQTFRHLSDYNFSQVVKARDEEKVPVLVDFMANWDGIEADSTPAPKGLAANYNFQRAKFWAGKIITFPIGERWLAISLTAAIGGAMFTLTAMPVLALISMAWVYRVRIAKSLQMAKTKIKSLVIVRQLDLGWNQMSISTRFDWMEPSLLRALELGVLIVLFAATGIFTGESAVAAFVILFSIAFHHYDNLYRAMQGEQKPKWLSWAGLTVLGRLLLLSVVGLLGIGLEPVAGYFLLLFLVASSIQWVLHRKMTTIP